MKHFQMLPLCGIVMTTLLDSRGDWHILHHWQIKVSPHVAELLSSWAVPLQSWGLTGPWAPAPTNSLGTRLSHRRKFLLVFANRRHLWQNLCWGKCPKREVDDSVTTAWVYVPSLSLSRTSYPVSQRTLGSLHES